MIKKVTQVYIAFRRIKNFACVEIHPQTKRILMYLKVDPDSITPAARVHTGMFRTVGHFGTGDLEASINSYAEIRNSAEPLIAASDDNS